MLSAHDIDGLLRGNHRDPFAVLGPHAEDDGRWSVRVFLPGAADVEVVDGAGAILIALSPVNAEGVFEGVAADAQIADYRLNVRWADGNASLVDDPYRFGAVLGDMDAWLLAEGSHLRPFEILGANPRVMAGVHGTAFAVWAPNASRVSVVGDFNHWDGRRHPMRLRRECGVWELFLPGVGPGARYKYELLDASGTLLRLKADPCGRAAELRPSTASVVSEPLPAVVPRPDRARANAIDAPISIYEVHLGSWRRIPEEGNRWLNWDELADSLLPYASEMAFTHVELLPVSEHPFDGSWGYQPIGLYAVTARFGPIEGFRRFVERAHEMELGVI
ncbi:MAG TPA: 1,4-alpha-glucan branching enzyme, partial [Burkholderiaceae bacterium]|nr:1,4-alpha-glucan branching enzyme [Burkholderiaceae bacterium]